MKNLIIKILLIIIILPNLSSCSKDCSDERTEIYEYYQDLINKAKDNHDQQDRFRDERDKKLAELDC